MMDTGERDVVTMWRNLGVCVWRSRPDEASAQRALKLTRELIALYPEGFGLLNILDSRVHVPTSEARAIFSRALQMASPQLRRAGVVIEGSGFQAAAVRAFSAGINLFIKAPFPFAMFETVS